MNQLERVSLWPETFVSYSINYEDVILRRLFPGKTDGFFVDIGAQHPELDNDLFGLYQMGWRGINVEPNPSYFALLQAARGRDRNLQLAVSDVDGEPITFFEVEGSGLSTCDEQQAMACTAQGYTIRRHDLLTSTLRRLLEHEDPPHIDIMKVDVEGFEEKVLAGNDWTRYRPDVVLVEATYPETPVKRPTNITANLAAVGYRHVYFDGLNDFYAEDSFVPPIGAFAPPNVFDRFVRLETVGLRKEIAALQEALQAQKASFTSTETYAHDLEADRRSLEKHLSDAQSLQASLQQRLAELAPVERACRIAEEEKGNLRQELERVGRTLRAFRELLTAALLDKTTDLDHLFGVYGYIDPLKASGNLSHHHTHDPHSLVPFDPKMLEENGVPRNADAETIPPELMIELLRQRVRGLIAGKDQLSDDIDDLRHENRRLLAAVSQLQGENLALNRALRPAYSVNSELATISATLERLRGHVDRDADISQVNQQRALAEASAAQARLRVEGLENSTSWRVTKPLRVIGRLLKGRG
jgi:FkbM family methyltransferase